MTRRVTNIPSVPDRATDAHKGDVGRVLVVGGSVGDNVMIGAPSLAAKAALRSGCGLVQIAAPKDVLPFITMAAMCATGRRLEPKASLAKLAVEFGADVVAVGPGLGETVSCDQLLGLLSEFSGGIVIDADGLNALAGGGRWEAKWPHNVVLTPHPGEMRRLLAGWGADGGINNRADCCQDYARQTGVVVVLKGHGTVVSDGNQVYVNQTGNAGMASAGTGDVLTGVIAGLMGQDMTAFDAAVLGVHVHGLAGDNGAEQLGRISLMATDLLDFLPDAFCDLSQEPSQIADNDLPSR